MTPEEARTRHNKVTGYQDEVDAFFDPEEDPRDGAAAPEMADANNRGDPDDVADDGSLDAPAGSDASDVQQGSGV